MVLEEKVALGLAAPPSQRTPAEALSDAELLARALQDRAQRARDERMHFVSAAPKQPWTTYQVTSRESGRSYRVALRGVERGDSYCSCPDFRKNTLGTCKHILRVLATVKRRFGSAELGRGYRRKRVSLSVDYAEDMAFRLRLPARCAPDVAELARPFDRTPVDATHSLKLLEAVRRIEQLGHDVLIYPDAEELIEGLLLRRRLARTCAAIRRDPLRHPLRRSLLRVELLPYQLDGIAFAVAAGRAVLADDMGLGKTIQAIGVAELLSREADIRRVLVVCPASVKSQWVTEIERFSARTARTIVGAAAGRAAQYGGDQFFTVCNYEQVLRDLAAIEARSWDLIVLDEAQRIKNWEAKTARVIKTLESPFALVLSGTPLENRLDELYSIVEFIDDRRLGPAFRFFHTHRVVDENGRVLGFKNLDKLRATLAPVLLRRTRDEVMKQLPGRTTEIVRVQPTQEQLDLHNGQMRVVASIVRKAWLSEVDLLRLRKALLLCRMAADSTFLVDKRRPAYSSKLERLAELFDDMLAERERKIVLFSEWTTMLDEVEALLAPRLRKVQACSVRLEGKVPQQKRHELVRRFREDPACRVFLTTNAGATGLNLQAANTVVNVDLPWNPALLEQRVGRAHRLGQKRPVQVFVLVTEGTIEASMLGTLSAKHELFQAVLDPDSRIDEVELHSGMEELRRRLEVLIGTKAEAPVDESERERVGNAAARLDEERVRVAEAGGRMLSAAFEFLGELLPAAVADAPGGDGGRIAEELRSRSARCVEVDASGRMQLTVTLPARESLDRLAKSLAHLLSRGTG
ncbi:MAG TPA: DEAD/DEAH box helicase [Planctomycetota bacterium]|nr:DEAD/DEAH box helicase [Planctomycetota bacterium]